MSSLCKYLLYGILLFHPTIAFCQPSLHYIEKVTAADGLSSNRTTDIIQDRQGFLWIGTAHGLNRYDGTEVTHYFAGSGKNNITDNIIFRLVGLDTDHIAIATHHGISVLDIRRDTFKHVYFSAGRRGNESDSIWAPYDNMITLLEKDRYGNLWAGTPTCIYRLDSAFHIQKIFRGNDQLADIRKKRLRYVYKILPLESGNVLVWLKDDIYVWQPPGSDRKEDILTSISRWKEGRLSFLKGQPSNHCFQVYDHYLIYLKLYTDSLYVYDEHSGRQASCYFPDYDPQHISWHQRFSALGGGWLAFTYELKGMGLVKISDENQQLSIHYESKVYFPDYTFRKMKKDQEGNWWVTTDVNGLLKMVADKQLFHEKDLFESKSKKNSRYEISSFLHFRNSLFIASYGDGLYEWNLFTERLKQHALSPHNFSENMVWNIRHEQGDTLWVGTQQGLLWYNMRDYSYGKIRQPHPRVLDSFPITTQFTDSKGLVWMGLGLGHGLCRYDPDIKAFRVFPNAPDAYPFRYPVAIAEDSSSNLWFLSDNVPELVYWNRASGKFKVVSVRPFAETRYKPTVGFYLDQKGNIWYGMESIGLVCYNIESKTVETYGQEEGLNSDLLYSIWEDSYGRLWIATSQGVSCFYPRIKRFENYGATEGLPATNCSANFYFDTLNERLYAGSPGKVIYFSPRAFQRRSNPMKVQITGIEVDNNPVPIPADRKMRLSWQKKDLTLQFTGINLTDGVENRYAYRIGNNKWVNIGSQRQIRFASLSPGDYSFSIRAARTGETWSPVTEHLRLTIPPPFTRTAWFYLLLVVAIGCVLYAWYRYRYMQLLKLEKMRSRISHDLHDEIGSRLTNISLMSMIAQRQLPKTASVNKLLERIHEDSQKISQSMREIIWDVNPDNDILDHALPRMLHYATDLLEAKDINVNANIPELQGLKMDMKKRHDLFLIFKEAINNIVRHSEAENVTIALKLQKGFFRLQIADDGKGFKINQLPYRNGLQYMKERAALHQWDFCILSEPAKGTLITLRIKLG